nr:MAG TPA: hypothetical protein [Caudoviricetes sp.]
MEIVIDKITTLSPFTSVSLSEKLLKSSLHSFRAYWSISRSLISR